MPECDGFFDNMGIPFEEGYQDDAVRAVMIQGDLSPSDKKNLIICWFDVTNGYWEGNRFHLGESRAKMAEYLATTPYRTYEEFLAVNPEESTNARIHKIH